jgi:predicted nucleic acid-binding protein
VVAFFAGDLPAAFGAREAERASALCRRVRRARQRSADLAIAACAIEHGASLWTLNRPDFDDVPELTLYPG